MADKYQAKKNNKEVQPEKSKKEQKQESSAKVAKTAAKAAASYFAPGVGGTAVDMVAKTKAGQKVFNKAGKILAKTPVGNISKKLDDKGVVDLADKATDLINPASGATSAATKGLSSATKGANMASKSTNNVSNNVNSSKPNNSANSNTNKTSSKNNSSDKSSNNGNKSDSFFDNIIKTKSSNPFGKIFKYKLLIGAGSFLFFLLMITTIVSGKDFANLDLTNKSSSLSHNRKKICSKEEVENRLLYIGDSRTFDMSNTLTNDQITYIAEIGQGYDWLTTTATTNIETSLQEKPNSIVILALGVNDLNNIDNYISYYNSLIEKYPNNKFFVLSVNPVDETKALNFGYTVTNEEIENFNNKLKLNFPDIYINSYDNITIETEDGLHYSTNTSQAINNYVTTSISNSGTVTCGGYDGNFVNYYQYDYTQSYGYGSTIASSGCGPTSMAMILTALTNEEVTPVMTADWSLSKGYRVEGIGTSWDFFPAISTEYGINCEEVSLNAESILSALSQGKLLIMSMGPSTFTQNGHFIVLTGLANDNKITIADPNSEEKSQQTWDVDIFVKEGRKVWAFSN